MARAVFRNTVDKIVKATNCQGKFKIGISNFTCWAELYLYFSHKMSSIKDQIFGQSSY